MELPGFLRSLLSRDEAAAASAQASSRTVELPPDEIPVAGASPFPFASHLKQHHGLPIADWEAVQRWLEQSVPAAHRPSAWADCERAWLQHFRAAPGCGYHLEEGGTAACAVLERPASTQWEPAPA